MPKLSMPNVKQLTNDASTMLSRAKQYTEEKLGSAEKTEYDQNFESLLGNYEKTKKWTEQLKSLTEIALQPNPNTRMEDYLYLKLDKKPPERQSNFEQLGIAMADAGSDLGTSSAYGGVLVKCGEAEIKLADEEHKFFTSTIRSFLHPICNFLEGDSKTIQKEKKELEKKRLDLDICKNKVKKAKSSHNRQDFEGELRVVQTDFDRQQEITKLLLEGINSTQAQHTRGLIEFIDAQLEYYENCRTVMADLKDQLKSVEQSSTFNRSESSRVTVPLNSIMRKSSPGPKKARVLYDYDAADATELSLLADEIIFIDEDAATAKDWVFAIRGNARGKVPVNYITVID